MLPNLASAAPPADCVKKHAGRWQITVRATGQTYPADLFPNGTGVSHCPGCAPGTWTCSGNTSTVFVNGITVVSTLSPDGRTATSGCCTSTRIGRGPAVAAAASKSDRSGSDQPSGKRHAEPTKRTAEKADRRKNEEARKTKTAAQQPAPPKPAARQASSCSDITGTKSGGKSQVNCKPNRGQKIAPTQSAAQPVQKPVAAAPTNPPPPQSAPTADQQAALAGGIIDELGKVRSGQVPRQPLTGASASPGAGFDPQRADPYRRSETLPVEAGQSCVPYFRNMLENFKRRAALCLRDTRLLRSLTDMVETDRNTTGDVHITRNTAPELFAHFDPMDPRWTISTERASPNCDLPLTVATQSEAFMECARVYLCGARAAHCGLEQAARTKTNQCLPISHACLATNPVPQHMTADPSPPAYKEPPPAPPLPNPPRRESTITGPSGPGGGSSGGGVMSAQ
jgi:hypothetical protein